MNVVSEVRASAPSSDFLAAGAATGESTLRFQWTVDDETLKDVNRASGMDSTASHARGFLSKLVLTWADTSEERRPTLEVPTQLSEDLVYIPSPCYIFAVSEDGTTLHCWYSVLVDAGCGELLDGKAGVRIFTITGDPKVVSAFIDGALRQFRFRSKSAHDGYTFHRRM